MPISAPPPRQLPARKYIPSPDAAGLLSFLCPGLGQIWSGEKRKGSLFMLAHLINLSALINIVCAPFILKGLGEFGERNHMKLNMELSHSFADLGPGSPASIIVALLLLSFSLFAARDAFDQIARQRRQAIYHDYVVAMPEATSGSYIFHVSLLLACLVLAFFFLIPPLPKAQFTVIEFRQTPENTNEKVVTNKRAQNASRAAGHNDPHKLTELSAGGGSASPQKSTPRATKSAPSKTARSAEVPAPDFAPHPQPQPPMRSTALPAAPAPLQLAATPMPAPPKSVTPTPTPSTAVANLPSLHLAPNPVAVNKIAMAMPGISGVAGPKLPTSVSTASSSAPAGAPTPVSVTAATNNARNGTDSGVANNPTPVPVGGHGSRSGTQSNGSNNAGPNPTKASNNLAAVPGGGPGSVLTPVVVGSGPATGHGHTGQGANNNPANGPRPGESEDTTPDVNWSPYMADLQRRIKRNWYPPRSMETKRVKVIFTLSNDGSLSNLRILRSSGLQVADIAALKAVENAAPFRPLPPHAPASVDIEFTFDYNIFSGSGSR